MLRRLFIALILIIALSLACWILLPRIGWDVPAWLPFVGYAIIAGGVLLPALAERMSGEGPERDEFLIDDPGPSQSDIEKFGDEDGPGLKIRR